MKTNIIHYKDIECDLSDNLKIDIYLLSKDIQIKNVSMKRYLDILFRILISIEYKYDTNENTIIFCPNKLILFSQKNLDFI